MSESSLTTKTATISDLEPTLVDTMPVVDEKDFNNAVDTTPSSKEAPKGQVVDSDGIPFDPKLHMSNADGTPRLTKTGYARKRKGVTKAVAENIMKEKACEGNRRIAAATATHVVEQLGVAIGGADARYRVQSGTGIDEKDYIFSSFDAYFEAKEISDFPAGVALVLGLSVYGARVMGEGQARNRTKTVWYALKSKFGSLFGKKKKGKDDAQSDTRNDGQRENVSSQTTGS